LAHLSAEQQAFVFSTRKGNLERMKEEVEAGAGVDTAAHRQGFTAYHWTAFEGHFEIMEWLASSPGRERATRHAIKQAVLRCITPHVMGMWRH
jgi:hypothetical protein